MRYPNRMGLVVVILSLLATDARAAPLRVLITAFEPYDGRKENGSEVVAKKLAALSAPGGVEFQTCVLPVEFGKAAKKAETCYEKQDPKPDMVISLGEALCDTEIEASANNMVFDVFKGDAKGVKRAGKIDPAAPEEELLTLPVPEMYCSTGVGLKDGLVVSASPGYFVCNDVTYRLARYLKPKNVPFGFIHVAAPGKCSKPYEPEKTAAQIRTMALAAAHVLNEKAGKGPAFPEPCENTSVADELLTIERNMNQVCRAAAGDRLKAEFTRERAKRFGGREDPERIEY